jgi:hypothetical protein
MFRNITSLDCSHCDNLNIIHDELSSLKILDCSDCPLLESIPETFDDLNTIYCWNCDRLTFVSDKHKKCITDVNCVHKIDKNMEEYVTYNKLLCKTINDAIKDELLEKAMHPNRLFNWYMSIQDIEELKSNWYLNYIV